MRWGGRHEVVAAGSRQPRHSQAPQQPDRSNSLQEGFLVFFMLKINIVTETACWHSWHLAFPSPFLLQVDFKLLPFKSLHCVPSMQKIESRTGLHKGNHLSTIILAQEQNQLALVTSTSGLLPTARTPALKAPTPPSCRHGSALTFFASSSEPNAEVLYA